MSETHATPSVFGNLTDLLSADLGGQALICSDDFFASIANLTQAVEPEWREEAFTERGKWMDGWESRRKRSPGNDWCILRLGAPGQIRAIDIDTRHFTGNHAPFAALDGCVAPAETSNEALRDQAEWVELLPPSPCKPGGPNLFSLSASGSWTHVRLRIFPAGGVARLRCFGIADAPDSALDIDLASAANGSRAICCSDQYFADMNQLISTQPALNMGSGWETKRLNRVGEDWLVLQLGQPGCIRRVELDTKHFKGNFPDSASLQGLYWPNAPAHLLPHSEHWRCVLPAAKLSADASHSFEDLEAKGPFTHLRLKMFPDGGISRMRCYGSTQMQAGSTEDALLDMLNALSTDELVQTLARCCGSRRWAASMAALAPFKSRAQLFGEADNRWWRLAPADWLEAFTHHPQIGADVEALRAKFAVTADWSEGEQAGIGAASEETLQTLASENTRYAERFGFIFIVCASGKSATQMLALLQGRADNHPAQEVFIAAGEQNKITALRLEKLR
jgi:allantoicase